MMSVRIFDFYSGWSSGFKLIEEYEPFVLLSNEMVIWICFYYMMIIVPMVIMSMFRTVLMSMVMLFVVFVMLSVIC